MERTTVVVDETTTSLVSIPAGPRAVLSRDDSDGESSEIGSSPSIEAENNGFGISSSSYSSFSSSDNEEVEEGFVRGNGEAVAKPRVMVPIAKLSAYEEDNDDDYEVLVSEEEDEDACFSVGARLFSVENVSLKVRSFTDEDSEFEEEEPFQTSDNFYGDGLDEATPVNSEAVDEDGVAEIKEFEACVVEESELELLYASEKPDLADPEICEVAKAMQTGEVAVIGEHDALSCVEESKEDCSVVDGSVRTETGCWKHDSDHVDSVFEPQSSFEGLVNYADDGYRINDSDELEAYKEAIEDATDGTARLFIQDMEGSSDQFDAQILTDSAEADSDDEQDGNELHDSVRSASTSAGPNYPSLLTSAVVFKEKLTEEERDKLQKIQQLRVKLEDPAKETALKLEEQGNDNSSLSLNILVLGKSGVGKSATINSIFGEYKARTDPFEPGTKSVTQITGIINGVNLRLIDTPGLRSSALEQGYNRKVLSSVKKLTKKSKFHPDVVLYVDRLDSQTNCLNDLPLLRTITSYFGSSIWRNAIIALTHAGCEPPDGSSGAPLSYEAFVAHRSHIVQQSIGQAVPVTLVENQGPKLLPHGQPWKPKLMLLCFSKKILSEACSVSKAQDSVYQSKLLGFLYRLSSLFGFLEMFGGDSHASRYWVLDEEPNSRFSTNGRDHPTEDNLEVWFSTNGRDHPTEDNLEVCLRDSDYPIGQGRSLLLLSLLNLKDEIYLGAKLHSEVSIGGNSKMGFRIALNNRMNGSVTVRSSRSDHHIQIGLVILIPIVVSIFRRIRSSLSVDDGI